MPPTPIVTTDSIIASASLQKVYTRKRWGDEWEERKFLWCNDADFCVSPSIPEASLEYIYGEGIEPGAEPESEGHSFHQIEPLELLHHYVKIETYPTAYGDPPTALDLDEPFFWYGVIEESTLDHAGSLPSNQTGEERVPTGRQMLRCLGMQIFLERTQIASAFTFDFNESIETEVGRAVTFNAGLGQAPDSERRGNMSVAQGERETFVFAGRLDEAQEWTAQDILKYLVAYHQPRDAEGNRTFNLVLDPEGKHANLAVDKPILETSGRTLRALLDQLADRRRLHCWTLIVDEENEQIKVRVVPFTDTVINLEDGGTIEPNPNQRELDFERAFDVTSAITNESMSASYDQVIIRGAKRGCVGTFCADDETLEPAWDTGELETEYEAAETNEAGYLDDEEYVRFSRNGRFREAPKFESVFAFFRVPRTWDWKVGDGTGSTKFPICPKLNQFPDSLIYLADPVPMWRAGLRFSRVLPLEIALDYEGNEIRDRIAGDPPRPPDAAPDATYLTLRAFIEFKPEDEDVAPTYCLLDRLSEARIAESGTDPQYNWNARTTPLENELGVEIRAPIGRQPLLAPDEFDPQEGESDRLNLTGQFISWRKVRITAMIEADEYLQAAYPTTVAIDDLPGGDTPRVLVINVGDRLRLDYVAKGTWVGVKAGIKQQTTDGGFVRDDRLMAQNLARIAGAWYLIPRQAFTLQFKQVRPLISVGDLITTIKQGGEDVEVNSLVTRVRYDFNSQTTSLQTDFAELDVGAFF